MRKRIRVLLTVIGAVLVVLFVGFSSFIGLQVFAGSTQLITNEETKGISVAFWEKYGIDYESFNKTYKVETVELSPCYTK